MIKLIRARRARRRRLEGEVARAPDAIMELIGLGEEVWKGVDPDEYVEELRGGS